MLRLLFLYIQVATTSSPGDAVCLATRPARTASVLRAAHLQSLGGYAKSLANLKKKNLISVTPLS